MNGESIEGQNSVKTKENTVRKECFSKIDSGLYCFITIARFHGINADPEQIKHNLAIGLSGMGELDILKAAKEFGLKSKAVRVEFERLAKLSLPAIVELKQGEFIILAKTDGEKLLVLSAGAHTPKVMSADEFKQLWKEKLILVVPRLMQNTDRTFGIKWFIPTLVKYKKPLMEVLVAAFSLQILGLFSPIITQVVIDKVLVHHGVTTLDVMAIGLIMIAIFETVMWIARNHVFTHTTSKIDVILGARLLRHLFSLPLRYFEVRRVGDTIARVRELENIRHFLTGAPLTSVLDVMFIIVYIIVMLFYSTTLTWVVLGSIPFFVALSVLVTPLFKQRLDEKFNCGAESQSYLVEAVTGVQTIKSFAFEPEVQKKWEGLLANYTKAGFKTAILAGNANVCGQFIQKISDLAILWFGAHLVMDGDITVGQLVAFRMLSGRVSNPVLRLVQMWQDFQQTGLSIKRLGDIFNTKPEQTMNSAKTRLPAVMGYIKFEKVRFRYRLDSSEAIRDMSFEIMPGTVVGVVGRSGSGKSTISKLIQRLYIPEAGKILIDGVDISLADPSWLRRQIGVVLIAHRLSTLRDAQKIMAIDRGQLVEYGSREELLQRKGLFFYLHSQQEGGN